MTMRKSATFDKPATQLAVEAKDPKTKASPRYPPKE
jgi:hypothetical protein